MRARPRTDTTQAGITEALRAAGYLVQVLAAVGGGVPDLLIGTPWGELVLLEAKNSQGRGRRLTEAQATWHMTWRRFPICVAGSPSEALAWLLRRQAAQDRRINLPGGLGGPG